MIWYFSQFCGLATWMILLSVLPGTTHMSATILAQLGLEGPACPHSQIWQLTLVVFQGTLVLLHMASYLPLEWTGLLCYLVVSGFQQGERTRCKPSVSLRLWKLNNITFTPILLVKVNHKASPDSMSEEDPTFEGRSSSVSYKEAWDRHATLGPLL